MVFAHRVKFDVTHHHHAFVWRFEERITDDLAQVGVVATREPRQPSRPQYRGGGGGGGYGGGGGGGGGGA